MADSHDTEIWRPVVGYEGLYEISSHGRARSLGRIVSNGAGKTKRLVGKLMRLSTNGRYLLVALCREAKYERKYIHRLVLEAFVGPCPEGMEARHFPDSDKGPITNCLICYGALMLLMNQIKRRMEPIISGAQ